MDATSNKIDRLIIPLNKNSTEGITDSASALNILLFLKQMIQITQYAITNVVSTIRYMANASSDHHPNHVPGIFTIINIKHPNLPVCSATSTNLFFHLFFKPSLHLIAKIKFGIIITAIIINPNTFNHSIYSFSMYFVWYIHYNTLLIINQAVSLLLFVFCRNKGYYKTQYNEKKSRE